jgi:hypothetical protein
MKARERERAKERESERAREGARARENERERETDGIYMYLQLEGHAEVLAVLKRNLD